MHSETRKILLISMPFGALERPALGLSLLKALLARDGVPCDVRYLNFAFADLVGVEQYQWISSALPYIAFPGDWSFTEALYGERPECDAAYIDDVLREKWRLDEASIARIRRVRMHVSAFLGHCLAAIRWQDYSMVGFTSTFEQNIASLALARRVKELNPDVSIVFGGANWEGEMGQELHRRFSFVDFVCSGEADESFPALVRGLREGAGRLDGGALPPGVVFRRASDGASISTGRAQPVRQLDALPHPDFSDYFRDLAESSAALTVVPTVLAETSRGCWWGDKSHCVFCGLNGANMTYRSKSSVRVLEELGALTETWRTDRVEVVDNILDMTFFTDLLPELAARGAPWELFYEVKANLSRKQVALLHAAGIRRIQPGIESLSDHVLTLMRKGTTGLRNIQLLKWCRELGVRVDWNILHGFPGETPEDYAITMRLLRAIRFLDPPVACGPIRLDRFSPYFETPDAFGFTHVRPIRPFETLYPFPPESLQRIAYYFDFDYRKEVDPRDCAAEVVASVHNWCRSAEPGTLQGINGPDGTLVLRDTRSDALRPEVVLRQRERAAYVFCDEIRSLDSIARHLASSFPDSPVPAGALRRFLDALVAGRLMVTDGRAYLSLAVGVPCKAEPSEAEARQHCARAEAPVLVH